MEIGGQLQLGPKLVRLRYVANQSSEYCFGKFRLDLQWLFKQNNITEIINLPPYIFATRLVFKFIAQLKAERGVGKKKQIMCPGVVVIIARFHNAVHRAILSNRIFAQPWYSDCLEKKTNVPFI